jgi:hypothetical protein
MTYGEFLEYVSSKCLHETIYTDSEGHPILVIRLLDAYGMVNKLQRPWVELTDEEIQIVAKQARSKDHAVTLTNKLLREKNT